MITMPIGTNKKAMESKVFRLTRDVTKHECPWLYRDYKKGEIVFEYPLYIQGNITNEGIACSDRDWESPYFELPKNCLGIA
jgi:hypothetical protein